MRHFPRQQPVAKYGELIFTNRRPILSGPQLPATMLEYIAQLNPLSFWKLDESSGTVATDEMGTSNGVYVGSHDMFETKLTPESVYANYFTGGHIEAPHVAAYNFTNDVSFVFFSHSVGVSYPGRLIARQSRVDPWDGFVVFAHQGTTNGKIRFQQDNTEFLESVTNTYEQPDVKMTCCIRRGLSLEIWVNGVLDNSRAISSIINTTYVHPIEIGARDDGSQDTRGKMDFIQIYTKALSPAMIQNLWNYHING